MSNRYPGYDVLAKRDSPSWNAITRKVVEERLRIDPSEHRFLTDAEWTTARAICQCIIPQPPDRAQPVPLAAMLDRKLMDDVRDGYRDARLPPIREAWQRALRAFDEEATLRYSGRFPEIDVPRQNALLELAQAGRTQAAAWGDMPAEVFFAKRLLHDILSAYYAHPTAWSEIGFGGPASPRGYVRLGFDRRDPWEASEARPGREDRARRENARVG